MGAAAASFGIIPSFANAAEAVQVEGPISTSSTSKPYGSAMVPGTRSDNLLQKYGYVEEEIFISGRANAYGPAVKRSQRTENIDLKPISTLTQTGVPYTTRLLILRPKDPAGFSGNVHVIPFHNVNARASAEVHLLRNRDVWVGVEVNSGTRFGVNEIPSGGVAHLLKPVHNGRYKALNLPGGRPEDWPDLKPGMLGEAFKTLNFGAGRATFANRIFNQELNRSYGMGPDIVTQVNHLLKTNAPQSPLKGFTVRRTYTFGASGGSMIPIAYINYFHDKAMLPDGRPPIDGYMIGVGPEPSKRPGKALLVMYESEAEAVGRMPSPDTDQPRFRYYEIPGAGHGVSAPAPMTAEERKAEQGGGMDEVLPPGIQGLNSRGSIPAGMSPYDKVNSPIIWALWHHMYRWNDAGIAMPKSRPITRDPKAPDGIARDVHGNALGGLRTPWVEVPEARYVARMSTENPLAAGMMKFDEATMTKLYGDRKTYLARVNEHIDRMVREGWVLAQDADLMRLKS